MKDLDRDDIPAHKLALNDLTDMIERMRAFKTKGAIRNHGLIGTWIGRAIDLENRLALMIDEEAPPTALRCEAEFARFMVARLDYIRVASGPSRKG